MKKFLLMILFVLCVNGVDAQTYKFKTTDFAYKGVVNNQWTDWTDWQSCDLLVVISVDRNMITIYSQDTQEYDIVEYQGEETDNEGKSMKFLCVNEDGLRCLIRLRVQNDGAKQLYVDFSDAMWVYNIIDR